MSLLLPGEASPSFAQTGADPILDDSASELFSYLDEDAVDLASEAGHGGEAYEMQPSASSRRSAAVPGPRRSSMRPMSSASTAVSLGAVDDETFTPAEDLAVRRKFDRKLVLFVALLFMLSFLDRSSPSLLHPYILPLTNTSSCRYRQRPHRRHGRRPTDHSPPRKLVRMVPHGFLPHIHRL